jgi:hypothetical protein
MAAVVAGALGSRQRSGNCRIPEASTTHTEMHCGGAPSAAVGHGEGASGVGSSAIDTPLDSKPASNHSPANAAPDVRMREL